MNGYVCIIFAAPQQKSLHFLKQGLHYVYVAVQQNGVNVNFATFLFTVLFFSFHTGVFTMLTQDQILAAHKSNLETLFGLTHKAFEGVEKLVELNLQVARAALTESADAAKAAFSVKDAQELMALQAGLLQPTAEKAASYSRHVYEIAAATNAEVVKVAEAQIAAAQKSLHAMIDTATKNAPAGTENAVSLVKSAVAAANNAYESVQKAAKQAADIADANFTAMTTSAVKATQAATSAAKPVKRAA